jgi:hypothetical protein
MEWAAKLGRGLVGLALTAAASGCADAFGIDDPTFDSCADGVCLDGGEAGTIVDATLGRGDESDEAGVPTADQGGPDRASEDASDTAPPEVTAGVRCGEGALRCNGATPDCCETLADGGATYACVAGASSCIGYFIQCGASPECTSAGDVCCHYASAIKCESPTTSCPSVVCEPELDGGCPAGQSCKTPALNEGEPSPYFICSP